MAERGFLIRNDLSMPLGGSGQELYLGMDHGRVGGRTAKLLIGRSLSGMVLGLRGSWKGMHYDIFAGQPISKPEGFKTERTTAGFTLTVGF